MKDATFSSQTEADLTNGGDARTSTTSGYWRSGGVRRGEVCRFSDCPPNHVTRVRAAKQTKTDVEEQMGPRGTGANDG